MSKKLWLALLLALLVLQTTVVYAEKTRNFWHPDMPLEKDPTWHYTVRLWGAFDPTAFNPIMSPFPFNPAPFHEFTDAEFAAMGEDRAQEVFLLKYENAPIGGATVYGLCHKELAFVLWMQRLEDGRFAQVGETAAHEYDFSMTPAENDNAGHVEWFVVGQTLYPRTWTQKTAKEGQAWTEYWGPFDPDENGSELRKRDYSVSFCPITFKDKVYDAVKITIVGPSEPSSDLIATEAFTFIHNIGLFERYFDLIDKNTGEMIFKHIAQMDDVVFPAKK